MNLQKLAEFLCFFSSSFRKGVKVAIKQKGILSDCLEIWYTDHESRDKGASRYQIWL